MALYNKPNERKKIEDITNKNNYFTKVEQEGVIKYRDSFLYKDGVLVVDYEKRPIIDGVERERVYNKVLKKPLEFMAKAIYRRYSSRFNLGDYTYSELETLCMTHVIEHLSNFDEWKPDVIKYETNNLNCIREIVKNSYRFTFILNQENEIIDITTKEENIDTLFSDIKKTFIGRQIIAHNKQLNVIIKFHQKTGSMRGHVGKIILETNEPTEQLLNQYYKSKYNTDYLPSHIVLTRKIKSKGLYAPITAPRLAFSYCQTIIKNFFNTHSKEQTSKQKSEFTYEDPYDFDAVIYNEIAVAEEEDEQFLDFFSLLYNDIRIKCKIETTVNRNDKPARVGYAIIEIMSNYEKYCPELTPNGNQKVTPTVIKRKVIETICQLTNLNKHEVVYNLKQFVKLYKHSKSYYIDKVKDR